MGRIPTDLTEEDVLHAVERLQQFIEENDFSQGKVAKMLGVSPAKLNQFLHNKYPSKKGIYELVNKSSQLIDTYNRKKRIETRGYVETTVAKQVAALITRTEALSSDEGKIGLLIGDGGHGKSICLRQFAKANLNTIYVQLDDTMRSKAIFAALADGLYIDSGGSLESVKSRLEAVLENRHIIIMLDEASGLRVKELNQLRQVIVVKCHCPLVLAGNGDLLKTVMQPKTRRGCESLDQFTSRLSYIFNLDEAASESRGGGLYTAADIRKLYEHGGIRLTGGAVNALKKICMSERSGRLRTCSNIITALHTSPKIQKRAEIKVSDIVQVIEDLRLPVRVWLPVGILEKQMEIEGQTVAKAG